MREETLLEKVVIGIIFIAFLVFWMWVPDFFLTEEECKMQAPQTALIGLCSEPKAK